MQKIIFFIFILIFFSCNKDKKTAITPKLNDVRESVYASVKIIPQITYFPQSNRSGVIQNIFVKEGDTVEKGQILFELLSASADNNLVDAKLNLEQAQANYLGKNNLLTTLKLDLKTAEQQLALDLLTFQRQERLWKQKIGTEMDFDKAKLKYQATANNQQSLKKKYKQTYQSLENNYKKAVNLVDNQRTSLDDYSIHSEIDGKIYQLFKEAGEIMSPQEKFAEIGSADNFKLEMEIDEVDIIKIKVADTAIITLEAYPKEFFQAKITKIQSKKNETTQTFTVEATFITPPKKIYYGLSGEANIIIATRKNVMTIPTIYLKEENKVDTEDGEKTVVIGVKNLDFVEIISGIDTTTVLNLPKK